MEKAKKGDFVEIKFTGKVNGKIFDSNIPEDLEKIDREAKPRKTIIAIGEGMIVKGLDNAFEGKEIGKEYSIHLDSKDGFGPRRNDLVKTIPLSVFTRQKIDPRPGATFLMDNMLARIITVSGARVITDFNNPLSGKDLDYTFTIIRVVTDMKEKAEAFFEFNFRFVPELEVNGKKVIIKGPKPLESFIEKMGDKFNSLLGAELEFVESDKPLENKN